MNSARHCKAARRLVGVILLTLLLAQWSALRHAIAHAPLGALSAPAAQSNASDAPWGHEADTPGCRLVDHLLIAPLAGADPSATDWFWPAAAPEATRKLAIVCSATLRAYEARGPPRA